MLALPPYESTEEDATLTKEELCLRLADVVNNILKDPNRQLIKLEIRWDRGKASFRDLYKQEEVQRLDDHRSDSTAHTDPVPIVVDDSRDSAVPATVGG